MSNSFSSKVSLLTFLILMFQQRFFGNCIYRMTTWWHINVDVKYGVGFYLLNVMSRVLYEIMNKMSASHTGELVKGRFIPLDDRRGKERDWLCLICAALDSGSLLSSHSVPRDSGALTFNRHIVAFQSSLSRWCESYLYTGHWLLLDGMVVPGSYSTVGQGGKSK